MTTSPLHGLLVHLRTGAIVLLVAYSCGFVYDHYGHDFFFGARAPIETATR